MARGNSRAQSELVDRLKAKIANRKTDEALEARGKNQTLMQSKMAYEKRVGPEVAHFYDPRAKEYAEWMNKGPLSVMKDSTLGKILTSPKTLNVDKETSDRIGKIALEKTDDSRFFAGSFESKIKEDEEDEDGDRRDYVDADGQGYDYDDTETTSSLGSLFLQDGGKTYRVERSVNVPIEFEGGMIRSTATSADDLTYQVRVEEVTMRPGDYVKEGRLIATYGNNDGKGMEYGAWRSSDDVKKERDTPEWKAARAQFEGLESQVTQWNSIIENNPRLNKVPKLRFNDELYNKIVGPPTGRFGSRY
jgi:hypothetical protein